MMSTHNVNEQRHGYESSIGWTEELHPSGTYGIVDRHHQQLACPWVAGDARLMCEDSCYHILLCIRAERIFGCGMNDL